MLQDSTQLEEIRTTKSDCSSQNIAQSTHSTQCSVETFSQHSVTFECSVVDGIENKPNPKLQFAIDKSDCVVCALFFLLFYVVAWSSVCVCSLFSRLFLSSCKHFVMKQIAGCFRQCFVH